MSTVTAPYEPHVPPPRSLQRIFIPLDGSRLPEQALAYGTTLARTTGASIELALVHVPFPFTQADDQVGTRTRANESAYLDHVVGVMRGVVPGVEVLGAHLDEPVIPALRERAAAYGADLIIMTSHGRTGFRRAWLGSVADAMIRDTNTPVLLLRSGRDAPLLGTMAVPLRRLLLPLDGSAIAEQAIGAAPLVAQDPAATLLLMQVVAPVPLPGGFETLPYPIPMFPPDPAATDQLIHGATQYLLRLRDDVRARTGRVAEVAGVFVEVTAAHAILAAAERHSADAIVMTTHGRGASRLLWGSVVDKVVRGTTLPLLVVRPG